MQMTGAVHIIAENQTDYNILGLPFRTKDTVFQPSGKFIPFVRCCFLFCHIVSSFFAGKYIYHILLHNPNPDTQPKANCTISTVVAAVPSSSSS